MIKNEKQYKITKSSLAKLLENIDEIADNNEDSLKKQLMLVPMQGLKASLEKQIKGYDALKN